MQLTRTPPLDSLDSLTESLALSWGPSLALYSTNRLLAGLNITFLSSLFSLHVLSIQKASPPKQIVEELLYTLQSPFQMTLHFSMTRNTIPNSQMEVCALSLVA